MNIYLPLVFYFALNAGLVFGDQAVKVTKTAPKRNGKVLLKGKCVFKISGENVPIGEAQFTLTMDTSLTRFKSKQVSVISDEGTTFVLENKKIMKPTKFSVLFSGLYVGDADTPEPTGTCSDLRFPGTTTSSTTEEPTTSTIITTEAPSSEVHAVAAEIENETSEGRCHTIQVACYLQVDAMFEPESVNFNLTFNRNVGRFQDNYGTYISQASEPGLWIYTSNKFQLDPPMFKYAFQITYHGDTEPEIHCNSILPPSGDRK